jgi:cell division protease FtsH
VAPLSVLSFPGASGGIVQTLQTWGPIVMMFLICVVLVVAVRAMPKRRAKVTDLRGVRSKVRWADVAGCDPEKAELQEVVEFLRNPARFRALGARTPRGVLLYGPPGTGKTLLAKAVAGESGARFYSCSGSGFSEMFVGLGAARVRKLFETARKHAPAIIFIDELDAAGARRGNDQSGEKDNTLNAILVEMDGFDTSDDVVVIAASNRLDQLDPALLRPGRFDRHIHVAPPDKVGRRAIIDVHRRGKPFAPAVNFERVVGSTAGMTGAELAHVLNESAIFAARQHAEVIEQSHIDDALERVIAGVASGKRISDREREIVAHHEAGHALASELLPSLQPVSKISLVPRGQALGYALNLPQEDRYLRTASELRDWMVMLLAGRAAEQLLFGEPSSGAANDLQKVYGLSRSMITEYGFGTDLGVQQLPVSDYSVSEDTRRRIDTAQRDLTEQAWTRALALVEEHREVLCELARVLLEDEVIERDRIVAICAPARAAAGLAPSGGSGSSGGDVGLGGQRARLGEGDQAAA